MNTSLITVFEFGYLSQKVTDSQCTPIDKAAFDYLEGLCLKQEDGHKNFLRLCSRGGHKALQVRNYVGVIHTPAGLQVEVLPKTTVGASSVKQSRIALLNMLRHLRAFRHIETTDARVATHSMPLLEVFVYVLKKYW